MLGTSIINSYRKKSEALKFCILVGSLTVTILLGRQYFSNIETFVPMINDIALGSKRYSIFQTDRCVGEARLDFAHPNDELWSLKVIGFVNVAKLGQANLEIELSFNSLGQLGGSIFSGNIGDIKFRGGTLGVKPIRILLREPRKFEIPYRGPVLLQKRDNETYSVALPIKKAFKTGESPFKVLESECVNKGDADLVTIPNIFKKQV